MKNQYMVNKIVYKKSTLLLEQLVWLLENVSDDAYITKCVVLDNATIGEHIRHIIEMYLCVIANYDKGIICYENRERNREIQTIKSTAKQKIESIIKVIDKENKEMFIETTDHESNEAYTIATNYEREIMYNMEHTIHHMAMIKIGMKECSNIILENTFGVADATLKYRKECAQ